MIRLQLICFNVNEKFDFSFLTRTVERRFKEWKSSLELKETKTFCAVCLSVILTTSVESHLTDAHGGLELFQYFQSLIWRNDDIYGYSASAPHFEDLHDCYRFDLRLSNQIS